MQSWSSRIVENFRDHPDTNARIHLSRISCIAVPSPSHAVDAGRCMMDGHGRANHALAVSPKSLHKSGSTEKAALEHDLSIGRSGVPTVCCVCVCVCCVTCHPSIKTAFLVSLLSRSRVALPGWLCHRRQHSQLNSVGQGEAWNFTSCCCSAAKNRASVS